MAGGSSTSNAPKPRKRVEADTLSATLKRARDGSAFARCEECKSSVPVALIDMHSCSLEAKIKMNLEAQVVEKAAEVKKPTETKKNSGERKKSAASSESESKPKKRLRKSGDSNKPKRPPTAFFIFMADFRVTFKEENPDSKKVSECAKLGGEKWKSLSEEEKKPYIEKAAELKAEYGKNLESNTTENANDVEIHQPEELCDEDA